MALCVTAHGSQPGQRLLSKTNVIEKLTALRNASIKLTTPDQSEGLSAFHVAKKRKGSLKDQMGNTGVGTILAPKIGDVEGIVMKILKSPKQTSPLYIELDPENIAYLNRACQWQLNHDDFKRTRNKKKVEDSFSADCMHEEIGGECVDDGDCVDEYSPPCAPKEVPPQESTHRELQSVSGLHTPVKSTRDSFISNFFAKKA